MTDDLRPPDGARLAPLERRVAWLSRPDIAWALPTTGLLFFVDGDESVRVAIDLDARELVASDGDATATRAMDVAALAGLWPTLWLDQAPVTHAHALLRWRGLFRELGDGPALEALSALVARQLQA